MTIIIGAGLSGLIAASLIHDAHVYEAHKRDHRAHKALLRFRSPAVGDALGIPFRPVTVRKGIFSQGEFVSPSIRLANLYATKVIGKIIDRSIWNLETTTRYIAPEDLAEQLVDRLGSRVTWEAKIDRITGLAKPGSSVISTAPMSVNCQLTGMIHEPVTFEHAAVRVRRWRIKDCDVHQTVYYPSLDISLYRASITGDLLIAEYVDRKGAEANNEHTSHLLQSFSLNWGQITPLDDTTQRFGKIAPIDEGARRRIIRSLTTQHGLYSLGRFATWRNILLDDVLNDIYVIKKLVNSDAYDAARIAAK